MSGEEKPVKTDFRKIQNIVTHEKKIQISISKIKITHHSTSLENTKLNWRKKWILTQRWLEPPDNDLRINVGTMLQSINSLLNKRGEKEKLQSENGDSHGHIFSCLDGLWRWNTCGQGRLSPGKSKLKDHRAISPYQKDCPDTLSTGESAHNILQMGKIIQTKGILTVSRSKDKVGIR